MHHEVVRRGREQRTWLLLARIGLVGLGFVGGFVLVYVVTVRTVEGRLFGDASLRGALLTRSALADASDVVLGVVSVASLLGALATVATIALVRLTPVGGVAAVGIMIGANGSAQVLKRFLLDRPDLGISEVAPATLNSLPSGHVTAVFSAVAAFVLVVPVRWRYAASLAGLLVALVTALATMSAGWHRAGDSMAAFLLVGAWAVVAAVVVLVAEPRRAADPPFEWPSSVRWLVAAFVGAAGLGLGLGALLDAVGPLRDAPLGSFVAFCVGGLLIVATGILTVLGVLLVLADVGAARATRRV